MVNLSIIPQTDFYGCVTKNKEYDVYKNEDKLFIYDDNGQEDTFF